MDKNNEIGDFKDLLARIETVKNKEGVDLSTEEDLSVAVMNLISLEEHLFFTGTKTEKPEYYDMLQEIRAMRVKLLGKMINKSEGEVWCISKHLLSASMRLMEVGTKYHADGKKKDAEDMFERSFRLYSIFWGLRLKILTLEEVEKVADSEKPWTLKDIVNKLVDCCDE